jgi:hypothetical protein
MANNPVRFENDQGEFILEGTKLNIRPDANMAEINVSASDLQKMTEALNSVPEHKQRTAEEEEAEQNPEQ